MARLLAPLGGAPTIGDLGIVVGTNQPRKDGVLPDSPKLDMGCRKVDFLFAIDNSGSMQGGSVCENAPNLRIDTNNLAISVKNIQNPRHNDLNFHHVLQFIFERADKQQTGGTHILTDR